LRVLMRRFINDADRITLLLSVTAGRSRAVLVGRSLLGIDTIGSALEFDSDTAPPGATAAEAAAAEVDEVEDAETDGGTCCVTPPAAALLAPATGEPSFICGA
jgi:hypothetical protein